jgi:hypothetical protein
MTEVEPTPMHADPAVDAGVRADLAVARSAVVEGLDTVGGLAALETAIAAQPVAATTTATASSMLAKVVVGAVVLGSVAVAWVASQPAPEPPVAEPAAAVSVAAPVDPVEDEDVVEPVQPVESVAPVPEEEIVAEDADPAPIVRPRRPVSKTRTPAPEAESLEDRLMREAEMIAEARRVLATDPVRALELTRRIAREFDDAQLVQEREALRIRALVGLGRLEEAQRRAEVYLRRHPRGPHADAVRRAIEGD